MRKVIKNVVKSAVAALSALLLLVVTLPIVLSLLVSIPATQNAIVRKVTAHLSEKLGTKVSIGHIDIKLVNRVEISDFYVEDFRGDTLLYVSRITAPVIEWGLVGEPLTFGRVKIDNAEMWLHSDPGGSMNIRELVRAIRGGRPPNPDPKFRMNIMGIEAENLTFGLLRENRPARERGVDFSRFVIRNTRIDIDKFSIRGDSVRIGIRSIAFDERSGMRIDDLSSRDLVVSRGAVALSDVIVRSGTSSLDLPSIRLASEERRWADFRNFADSVPIDVKMRSSHLSTNFLGCFMPAAAAWNIPLDDLSLHASGSLSSLSGGIERAHTLGTDLSLGFTSSGLPDLEKAQFDIDITNFTTSGVDIDSLVRAMTGKEVPDGILRPFGRVGAIGFTGTLRGGTSAIDASGILTFDAGSALLAATVDNDGFDARIATPGFDLGRTLDIKELGTASGELTAKGSPGLGKSGQAGGKSTRPFTGRFTGGITGLEFRGYTYTDIAFDGTLDDKTLDVELTARNPELDFDLAGKFGPAGKPGDTTPRYDLRLDLRRADLAATRLNRNDSVSLLSGNLTASLSGCTLDDANGSVEIRNAHYASEHGTVKTPLITLSARNDAGGKLITLSSEFANAEFRSRTGYRDMFDYLGRFLGEYIPLSGLDEARLPIVAPDGNAAAISNYSIIRLDIKNTAPLLGALVPSAQVAEGSGALFMFNPYTGSFSLSAHSDFLEYRGLLMANIELTSDNKADSLTLHLSSSDIYSESMHIPGFALHGGAKGRQQVDLSLDGRMWRVVAHSARFGGGRVEIDDLNLFSADNPSERLTATGIISRHAADTLLVGLNDFDLSPLGRFLGSKGLEVSGRATGRVEVISALHDARMNGGIELRDLSLAGTRAAPLHLTAFWDSAIRRIRFGMLNEATGTDVLHGSLSPRTRELDAVVNIDSLDLALLDPLLGGVMENTQGKADVRLSLGGSFRDLRMDGHIEIPHLETTVGYTKASYTLTEGVMTVANSVLTLPPTPVRDRRGGSGEMSMRVDMSKFSAISVGIDATARGLLVFDTDAGDSESFYGRVNATGSVGIRSSNMGTRMEISARTDAGTRIHLPLGARSNISWADLVVFADRSAALDTTNVLERKKLAYERRIAGISRTARRKPLDLNLTVGVTRDAEVHLLIDPKLGGGITATGEGVIGLGINPATDLFTMTGDYVISDGRFEFSMMDVFNKDFVIAPGSRLQWSGAPDDALLNVDASYRVRTSLLPLVGEGSALISGRAAIPVDCILQLRDRLSEPRITFDISLPSADPDARLIAGNAMNTQELKSMQFLSLLMTGSFASDNSITGQSASSGAMATGAVGFDILTNQLNNFLSSEDYNIYLRYRPQSDFTGNQFDVGLSTGFVNDRLLLEIEGNYVDDRAATSVGMTNASNLAGDFSLTWVIDRSGNLRLKVFSQRIDRRNETQGLQESGLGVYYKRDFDTFRDIFRRSAGRTGDKKLRKEKNTTFDADSVSVKTPGQKKQ